MFKNYCLLCSNKLIGNDYMTLREKEKILLQKIKAGDKHAYMELVTPFP